MHDYIKERTIKIGRCIVETRNTVRTIAKEFGVSKSTVHKDLTERLPEINPDLADQVKHILEYHKSIRHLRGGEATKIKYKKNERKKKGDPRFRQVLKIYSELAGKAIESTP
nr:sporulation transcriptional regulator SpoIIID [Paenibacillus sp. RC343]